MAASDLIGKTVGNFKVTAFVDAGAMGAIYRGEHALLGHAVAIKVMKAAVRKSPHADHAIQRFTAEAKALTRIAHAPNIIKLHDFGQMDDGQLYYVMEFLEGEDLESVIAQKAPMTALDAMPYLEQVCAGLQAAHDAKVVHRDLKPGNVFALDGEQLHLKLLDFGIAKRLDTVSKLTVVGMGSPIYAAPEQVKAETHKVGPATDIYSLGVLAYEMCTARLPYDIPSGLHPYAALMYPFEHDHIPLIERDNAFNPEVSRLIDRCLQRDPDKRPQNARAFIEAWARALGCKVPVLRSHTLATIEPQRPTPDERADTVPIEVARARNRGTTLGFATGESIPRLPRRPRWPFAVGAVFLLSGAAAALWLYVAGPRVGSSDGAGSVHGAATGTLSGSAATPTASKRPVAKPLAGAKPAGSASSSASASSDAGAGADDDGAAAGTASVGEPTRRRTRRARARARARARRARAAARARAKKGSSAAAKLPGKAPPNVGANKGTAAKKKPKTYDDTEVPVR